MKKALTLAALLATAFAAGMGTVTAVTYSYYIANDTSDDVPWLNASCLDAHNLIFTNNTTSETRDQIHMGDGNDRINLGAGNDNLGFAYGDDILDLSGGYDFITFGLFTGWPSPAAATNYISCNTPDQGEAAFSTAMEIRSDSVSIKANTGDVVIQLGNP